MEIRNILAKTIPDKAYIQLVYYKHFRKFVNFRNPKTFNEKLQWLKLYDRKKEYTKMVDKHLVKQIVADIIGDEYIIPTLGVWDYPSDINFDVLPKQFVLKWNHDSGSVIICKSKDELDFSKAVKKLSGREKYNGYNYGREWPYKYVKPKIIAEQYLEDGTGQLTDYKIHNFNGEPRFILVCKNRFSKNGLTEDFFTTDWQKIPVKRPGNSTSQSPIECPQALHEMLKLSQMLAKDIPFLRTDFYVVNGKVYFGEMTFYPASGFLGFHPEKYDIEFGKLLILPKNRDYRT